VGRFVVVSHLGQRIGLVILAARTEPTQPTTTDRLPTVVVENPVVQHAMKQRRPLVLRVTGVAPRKGQHGVLDDIQCVFALPASQFRHPQRSSLNLTQKRIQRGKSSALVGMAHRCGRVNAEVIQEGGRGVHRVSFGKLA